MSEEIYDPRERLEIFLNAVRTGDVESLPDPQTREEMYLAAIAAKSALPDPTDASVGDALLLDADKVPTWGPVTPAPKYMHNIKISKSGGATIFFKFVNSVANAYTSTTDALKALYALVGNTEVEASGFDTRTILESIKPTSGGTCAIYGTSLAYANNAISFTQDDYWNLSNMTGYACSDIVYEI